MDHNAFYNFAKQKFPFVMALLVIGMAIFFYGCTDSLEPNEPTFTNYTGPTITEFSGTWDFTQTVAIGQVNGETDTLRAGDLISVAPDSVDINGINYWVYQEVGGQEMIINAEGRYDYIINAITVLVRPGDSLRFAQQFNETGKLDVYDNKMIIISDSADTQQGSFLTGQLDYFVIDYSRTDSEMTIVGFGQFQFDSGFQLAQTYTTFRKR